MRTLGYFVAGDTEIDAAAVRAQEGRFYQECERRGIQPVRTFTDPVRGPRPAVEQLLTYREGNPGEFEVLVGDVDRLGAGHAERVERLMLLEGFGAKVSAVASSRTDVLARLLAAAQGTRRSAPDQEKARQGLQRRALQGQGLGKPPFGYRIGDDGKLEVVPREAETVRLIFNLYVNGLPDDKGVLERLGLRMIAGHLNERELFTRRGAHWSVVTVRDILKNRTYIGTYSRYGVRVANSHAAVISSELFTRADRLRARAAVVRKPGTDEDTPFLLSGLVFCGECDHRLIGATRRQGWTRKDKTKVVATYRYYRCGSRVNQSICGYHTHRADALEREVVGAVAARFGLAATAEAAAPPVFADVRRTVLRSAAAELVRGGLAVHHTAEQLRAAVLPLLAVGASAPSEEADRLPSWMGATSQAQQALLRGLLEKVVVHDDHIEPMFRDTKHE